MDTFVMFLTLVAWIAAVYYFLAFGAGFLKHFSYANSIEHKMHNVQGVKITWLWPRHLLLGLIAASWLVSHYLTN
jgi:hypothetical protein